MAEFPVSLGKGLGSPAIDSKFASGALGRRADCRVGGDSWQSLRMKDGSREPRAWESSFLFPSHTPKAQAAPLGPGSLLVSQSLLPPVLRADQNEQPPEWVADEDGSCSSCLRSTSAVCKTLHRHYLTPLSNSHGVQASALKRELELPETGEVLPWMLPSHHAPSSHPTL